MDMEISEIKTNLLKIIIGFADDLEWNGEFETTTKINRDMLDVLKESYDLIEELEKRAV